MENRLQQKQEVRGADLFNYHKAAIPGTVQPTNHCLAPIIHISNNLLIIMDLKYLCYQTHLTKTIHVFLLVKCLHP